ncbi:PiggyBac transposable element-derived protein 3 [Eumeta japonica]|uniref:PiggyBac transposable element-derived protein 3 n=1 Tax=Eumeta variegata TaxID=151549 RepID=A0A4C1VYN7_EUMVA|nr:PiggyBac transposable element-derived protein 3 [Eumeta japonica]
MLRLFLEFPFVPFDETCRSHSEDDDDILTADIYITPPEGDKSDEDSGDEDSGNINCLFKKQLLAEAEFWATVSTQSGIDVVDDFQCNQVVEPVARYNSVARYRMYWEQTVDCNFQGVASLMPRNRFEDLLRYFHVADNNNLPPNDKFAKSMIPYYGKHGAKQHIHRKPIRFGYKNWSICTRLGYLIYGELYQGASTGNTHPELGVGASVVLDLVSKLPKNNYNLYMDNFFTSLPLLEELKKLGHDGTGTIKANRVDGAPLKDQKEMKKTSRGSYHQYTDMLSEITLVRYNDNNIVTVALTQSGVNPIGKVKRYCDKQKKDVDQPRCFINYNRYMGGVDRLDQNVGCYRVSIRLKRWYWQLLMFPLNVCVNNAFQLYKMTPAFKSNPHDLLSFTRNKVLPKSFTSRKESSIEVFHREGDSTTSPSLRVECVPSCEQRSDSPDGRSRTRLLTTASAMAAVAGGREEAFVSSIRRHIKYSVTSHSLQSAEDQDTSNDTFLVKL